MTADARRQNSALSNLAPAGVLLAICGLWGWLRVPIPAVNEPHYLVKARHWWNPDWCQGDAFLASANPHAVYYFCFGWLPERVGFEATAAIVRVLGYVAVAWGWQRLSRAITGRRWAGCVAWPVFLALQALGNWSGEWLIGGTESKVFAYAALFCGWALCLERRWSWAACASGVAFSFHPVVGVWGVLTALAAASLIWTENWRSESCSYSVLFRSALTPSNFKCVALTASVFLLASTPGLLASLPVLRASSPADQQLANLLLVGTRLAHHLDPMQFPKSAHVFAVLLLTIRALLSVYGASRPTSPSWRWWNRVVVMALICALTGVVLAWGPRPLRAMPGYEWRISLLKFYPFRLADLLVPLTIALTLADRWLTRADASGKRLWILISSGVLTALSLWIPAEDQNPSRMSAARLRDWRNACSWIRENTADDALVYALDERFAVKWYAERPEYVNYKDMPQDAAALVEWNRRLRVISEWRVASIADGAIDADELRRLARDAGIRTLIATRFGPFGLEPDYELGGVRVYRIAPE